MLLNKDKRKGEEQILHSDNNLRYMYYNLVDKLTALGSGPGATGIKNRNKHPVHLGRCLIMFQFLQ
jgi:hypothetical protein